MTLWEIPGKVGEFDEDWRVTTLCDTSSVMWREVSLVICQKGDHPVSDAVLFQPVTLSVCVGVLWTAMGSE